MAVSKKDVQYVDIALGKLKLQLDNIETYLNSKNWTEETEEEQLRSAFNFQTKMFDKHLDYTKRYMELAGIMEFYHETNSSKEEEYMKGFEESAYMNMVKNDKI